MKRTHMSKTWIIICITDDIHYNIYTIHFGQILLSQKDSIFSICKTRLVTYTQIYMDIQTLFILLIFACGNMD